MGLTKARLGRAEDLTPEIRALYSLPSSGLIVIETKNPELRDNIIAVDTTNGIYGYLLNLGKFNEIDIEEDSEEK